VNELLHKVEVVSRETVETSFQLMRAIKDMSDGDTDLATTYVVEQLAEQLSDGAYVYSIRIRLAEAVS
jgi:hypothetical protein